MYQHYDIVTTFRWPCCPNGVVPVPLCFVATQPANFKEDTSGSLNSKYGEDAPYFAQATAKIHVLSVV